MEISVLCINASDSMGNAGIQADVRTIKDLGAHALTAVTSVTAQNSRGIAQVYKLPTELVVGQIKTILEECRPDAVKIGHVDDTETIEGIKKAVIGCRNVVCSPVILASSGGLLMNNDSIATYCRELLPIAKLLIVKCVDAEIMLGRRISTDADMVSAAHELREMGAENVLLRGGTYTQGRINAYLLHGEEGSFFSSMNIEGWQRHGVGGTLSTAIATRLAHGDALQEATGNAHHYLHCQVVYASAKVRSLQSNVLYDKFLSLVTDNYHDAHDVAFYAERLAISTRYLSQITGSIAGRSPKQIIDEVLLKESQQLLSTTTLTIQQIALQLGFSSQVAFAKFFSSKRGVPPSSCRRS